MGFLEVPWGYSRAIRAANGVVGDISRSYCFPSDGNYLVGLHRSVKG